MGNLDLLEAFHRYDEDRAAFFTGNGSRFVFHDLDGGIHLVVVHTDQQGDGTLLEEAAGQRRVTRNSEEVSPVTHVAVSIF
jgi:hypothetical protein